MEVKGFPTHKNQGKKKKKMITLSLASVVSLTGGGFESGMNTLGSLHQ
jgi:hypothetical protein